MVDHPPLPPELRPSGAVRDRLRNLEYRLPLQVQKPLLRIMGRGLDPYRQRNRELRAIFVHVPRTGGTSVARALGLPKEHYPISRFAAFDAEAFGGYFKFAFVRNPWDRLLSAYAYLRAGAEKSRPFADTVWARRHLAPYLDFEAFVLALRSGGVRRSVMRYIHFRPQLDWIALPGTGEAAIDFVGRFERLDGDYRTIAARLGVAEPLPAINASKRGSYRESYTPAMRGIVEDLYARDIDSFGYGF